MPVVFDEVIASVEAPPPVESPDAGDMQALESKSDDEKVITVIDSQQRWARRLEAN